MNLPHRENRRVLRHKPEEERFLRHESGEEIFLRHKPEEERFLRHMPEEENQLEDPSTPPAREDKEAVAGRETDGEVCDWQPAASLMIIKDLRSAQV